MTLLEVSQLRALLESFGASNRGTKEALVERLLGHEERAGEQEEPTPQVSGPHPGDPDLQAQLKTWARERGYVKQEYEICLEQLQGSPFRFKELAPQIDQLVDRIVLLEQQIGRAWADDLDAPPQPELPEREPAERVQAPAAETATTPTVEAESPAPAPSTPEKTADKRLRRAFSDLRGPQTPSDLAELYEELEVIEQWVANERLNAIRDLDAEDQRTWLQLVSAWTRHIGALPDVQEPQRNRLGAVFGILA
ncbi:MAG: SAP domain-containing protein [Myxococcota bacterium]